MPLDHPSESRINRIVIGSIVSLMIVLGLILGVVMLHEPNTRTTWRIAITNWPGYDPLYLADKKGFLRQQSLNIELIPINSMTDMRTAFERGTIDGYTTTIMDAVESLQETGTQSRIVLLTDYSTGADQLLVDPSITSVTQLRDKRVSLEITSPVARYMLGRSLSGTNLSFDDFEIRPYNQSILVDQTIRGNLDAVITYEPYTSLIRAKRPMAKLFSSADIPEEILDAVIVSPAMLKAEENLSQRLQYAWQAALDYATAHPEESHALLARRYGMDIPTYQDMLDDVHVFTRNEMQRYASRFAIQQSLWQVSQILYPTTPLNRQQIADMVAVWYQKEPRQ